MSDERRQQIVDAARQLYEEQGLSATTVKDISERCGVARSLFYHYFRNKQEVTSAVIDDFVNDYIESLQFWNEHRTPGDIEGSLAGVVTVMRVGVFEHSSFRRALDTHENASLYLEFINRVADRMAAYFVETTVQDYAQSHPIDIGHVYETFYVPEPWASAATCERTATCPTRCYAISSRKRFTWSAKPSENRCKPVNNHQSTKGTTR